MDLWIYTYPGISPYCTSSDQPITRAQTQRLFTRPSSASHFPFPSRPALFISSNPTVQTPTSTPGQTAPNSYPTWWQGKWLYQIPARTTTAAAARHTAMTRRRSGRVGRVSCAGRGSRPVICMFFLAWPRLQFLSAMGLFSAFASHSCYTTQHYRYARNALPGVTLHGFIARHH